MSTSFQQTDAIEAFAPGSVFGDFTRSFDDDVTAGSLLIVIVIKQSPGGIEGTFDGVSDDVNGAWTAAAQSTHATFPGDESQVEIWYLEDAGAGATEVTFEVTHVAGGGIAFNVYMMEVASTAGALAFVEGQTAIDQVGSTIDTPDVTVGNADNIAVIGCLSGANPTQGTGWTLNGELSGPNNWGKIQHKFDSSVGALTPEYGNSTTHLTASALFEVSGGGGGGSSFVARHPSRRKFIR